MDEGLGVRGCPFFSWLLEYVKSPSSSRGSLVEARDLGWSVDVCLNRRFSVWGFFSAERLAEGAGLAGLQRFGRGFRGGKPGGSWVGSTIGRSNAVRSSVPRLLSVSPQGGMR